MLLSVTSFWQHAQVQHPSCSLQIYQRSEMPLAGGGAWGTVAALSMKPFSATRPCFNDPEIAAGSWFSSVPRERLLRSLQPTGLFLCPCVQFKQQGRELATALCGMAETRRCYIGVERMGQEAWGSPLYGHAATLGGRHKGL